MTRILVPTDFSEPSLTAVRSGIELATAGGGVVFLLHVVEGASVRCYTLGERPLFLKDLIDPGGEYFRSRFNQKLIRRDFCEEARWKLDALVPTGCRSRVHTVVTAGGVVDEIVRAAEEQHADLILLGARGRRGWRHVFRRTLADLVRRKALIPVVTLDAGDLRVSARRKRCGITARTRGPSPSPLRSHRRGDEVSRPAASPRRPNGHQGRGRRVHVPPAPLASGRARNSERGP